MKKLLLNYNEPDEVEPVEEDDSSQIEPPADGLG